MVVVLLTLFLALVSPGVVMVDQVEAATDEEQRCRDLGANCICSEPLNTTTYTLVPGTTFAWDPGDSTRKPCAIEGFANGFYELGTNGVNTKSASNSATILNALPVGHAVSNVLKGQDGHADMWFLGTNLTGSHPMARAAFRAYVYFSSGYGWTGGSCSNSGKLTQLGSPGMITSNSNGSYGLYSFGGNGNFTPSNPDCCSKGPGFDSGSDTAINTGTLPGKWWRVEGVIIKRNATSGSPGLQYKMYMKDVTNNGPEYKVIDTSIACTTAVCGPGTGWLSPNFTTNLAPPTTLTGLWFDLFRNGTCAGYNAMSHYMAAAWSSDAGQRIGAAAEIEGGIVTPTTNTLTVVANSGSGSGTVTSSPAGINCSTTCAASFTTDSTITLTATANGGSAFAGWSGGTCSGSGSCLVTLSTDTTITALFNTTPVSGGTGIASNYLFDSGIGNDPAVIFSENFESAQATILARFNGWTAGEVVTSADVPAVSGGTQSMLFQPANNSVGATLYKRLGTDYSQLYIRYYIKYSGTAYHHSGTYMGGYSPPSDWPQGDAGYKGVREDGTSKLFTSALEPDSATGTRIDTYNNFVGMQGQAFNGLWYGRNYLGSYQIPILPGQWQCIEMMVKVNTAAGNSDGELTVWINGQQIVNFRPGFPVGLYDSVSGNWTTGSGSAFPGLQWRDTTSYGINWIKLQNYDTDGSPTQMRVDDLVVATSYIGPINTGNTGPTARTGGISGKIRGNGKVRFSAP